ncbi:CRISPR-associated protein Csx18 [Lyngbya aestuarii]|uniref:CRISPR-associated protein Csx18 n=1 Tax=Lyngbya aestuarii TaxID=118322 RepID=UPI00403DBA26
MYLSPRAAQVRNTLVSISNGSITLIILLIAPLGLAAVIINTLLVTIATYAVSSMADRVIAWLSPSVQAELLSSTNPSQGSLSRRQRYLSFLQRRRQ